MVYATKVIYPIGKVSWLSVQSYIGGIIAAAGAPGPQPDIVRTGPQQSDFVVQTRANSLVKVSVCPLVWQGLHAGNAGKTVVGSDHLPRVSAPGGVIMEILGFHRYDAVGTAVLQERVSAKLYNQRGRVVPGACLGNPITLGRIVRIVPKDKHYGITVGPTGLVD